MRKKAIIKYVVVTMGLLAFLLGLPTLAGCGNSLSAGINPYVFLTRVDSVDHTQFFIDAYQVFQVAGVSLGIGAEQQQALQQQQTQAQK